MRFGTAFGAGIVACVNPCGFIMLPTYLSLQLGTQETGYGAASWMRRTLAAVRIAAATTVGFAFVVAPVGVLVGLAGQALGPVLPYAATGVGAVMVALALWLLVTGRKIGNRRRQPRARHAAAQHPERAAVRNDLLHRASLSCALPIFLLVVSTGADRRRVAGQPCPVRELRAGHGGGDHRGHRRGGAVAHHAGRSGCGR